MTALLAIDVGTRNTGLCVLEEGIPVLLETIKFQKNDEMSLIEKADLMRLKLGEIYMRFHITEVYIEAPKTHFQSQSNANTMSLLLRFNAMIEWLSFQTFGIVPQHMTEGTARKLIGLKFKRGEDQKRKTLEHLVKTEPLFEVSYTVKGNPKPEYYDQSDALCLAKAGYCLTSKKNLIS